MDKRTEAANIITAAIADHDEGLAGAIDAHALVDRILALTPFADRVAGDVESAPPAAVAEQTIPEPPWEATSLGGNNAKREGWKAYHTKGRTREACPFPANRHDLLAAYCIGWDAAAEQTDGEA